MVWTGVVIPLNKGSIFYFVLGGALSFFIVFIFLKFNQENLLITLYNAVFWIFFAFFWGSIVYFILRWIWRKIFK